MKYILRLLEGTSEDSAMHLWPGQDRLFKHIGVLLSFWETFLLVQT